MRRNEPVMAPHSSAHPLDTDLFDLIEGSLDAASARLVQSHLEGCLLCRIKRQRLSDAPPIEFADVSDLAVPAFTLVDVQDAPSRDAKRGELWLTAGDEAIMVLVRTVRTAPAHGLVVVPVTLDVEAADDETLVLDETSSPLAVAVAIYEHLTISIGSHALRTRVMPVRDVDLFSIGVGDPGVSRGSAIDGPTDPRLEIRQYLTDRLTALDPLGPEEPEDAESASIDDIFLEMVQHLDLTRGAEASVDPLQLLGVELPEGWTGIAIIQELTVRVAVIDTPHGLTDAVDLKAAEAVFGRCSVSGLAVCSSEFSDMADMYDYSGLVSRLLVDAGVRASGPLFALPAKEAVAKFLDQKIAIPTTPMSSTTRGAAVDAQAIMSIKLADALAAVVTRGRKATIASKADGYTAVGSSQEALDRVLQQAFTDDFDVQSVVDVANEVGA